MCLPFKLGRSGAETHTNGLLQCQDAESRTVYSVLYEYVVKSVLVSKLRKVVYHFKYINNKQQQQKIDVVNTE